MNGDRQGTGESVHFQGYGNSVFPPESEIPAVRRARLDGQGRHDPGESAPMRGSWTRQ